MRVFITGITGMVGSHLAEYIIKEKLGEVYGLVRWRSPLDNINHFKEKVNLVSGDLNDLNSLIAVIRQVKPHRIFHLAAQSYVQDSFKITSETRHKNRTKKCLIGRMEKKILQQDGFSRRAY